MKAIVRENTWLPREVEGLSFKMDFGWGNGYVLIPEDHGLYKYHYDIINKYVDVHGGLTYSDLVDEKMIKLFNLEEEDLNKWMVGFDTCHWEDTLLRWPKEEVQRETDNLAKQLDLLCNETPQNVNEEDYYSL